ncbi:MAG: hypothetical protein NC308_08925 [Clostridium sp.]|nr:hypothetical protein [Bacteroides sp.]MCM1199000.1 hypothetical protein [Clostridium sp.]
MNMTEISIAVCGDCSNLFYCAEDGKCYSFGALTGLVSGIGGISSVLRSMEPAEAVGSYISYRDFICENKELLAGAKQVYVLHDGTAESVAEALRVGVRHNYRVHHIACLTVLGYVSFIGCNDGTNRIVDIGDYTCKYICEDGVVELLSISSQPGISAFSFDIRRFSVYGTTVLAGIRGGYIRDILLLCLNGYGISAACELEGRVRDWTQLIGKDCPIPARKSEVLTCEGYDLFLYISEKKISLAEYLEKNVSSATITADVDAGGKAKISIETDSGCTEINIGDLLQ